MHAFAARLLLLLVALAMRLPWPWLRAVADAMAARALRREAREAKVARRNLELAYPDLLPAERAEMQRAILRSTARQTVETLRLWTRPSRENLACIDEVIGAERLDAAVAAGRGVIVAAPHHGNWELLNQWLASRTPLAILYAPPDSKVGDAFLNRVRATQDQSGRVTQVRAEASGVRQLFKWLKDGGVVGILPDQQPKQGDGEFAAFFGRPALTMSLLGRLAARTGATVLVAWCERIADTPHGPRYALHVEHAPAGVADPDPAAAAAALNGAVEHVARRDPAQYQWTYKRFSIQPDGQNPYWPDCY
jgi:KDO2-lipid IV(A) lauroyltransferase